MRRAAIKVTNGLCNAPMIYVDYNDKSKTAIEDAVKEARKKSRLSDFESWSFEFSHVLRKK